MIVPNLPQCTTGHTLLKWREWWLTQEMLVTEVLNPKGTSLLMEQSSWNFFCAGALCFAELPFIFRGPLQRDCATWVGSDSWPCLSVMAGATICYPFLLCNHHPKLSSVLWGYSWVGVVKRSTTLGMLQTPLLGEMVHWNVGRVTVTLRIKPVTQFLWRFSFWCHSYHWLHYGVIENMFKMHWHAHE